MTQKVNSFNRIIEGIAGLIAVGIIIYYAPDIINGIKKAFGLE